MKQFIKKIFGIDQLEKQKTQLQQDRDNAVAETVLAQERQQKAMQAEDIAKMTAKERATRKGEPWVAVLDTKVNADNPRNGFFELDWNDLFIEQLKNAGYGFDGDPEEEIVDRWFRDLARNMLTEDGMDASRSAGFINVNRIGGGRAEVV